MEAKSLPNFIVIGAPKCGTTSLFHYIRPHPDIYLPQQKELHYFSCDDLRENCYGPGDDLVRATLPATLCEYQAHYAGVTTESAIGDISPSYLFWSDSSERILAELGRIKIVIMLRNPVEKSFSQYMHLVSDGYETLGFYDALMAEEERRRLRWGDIWRYAEHSLYTDKVSKYISVFGRDNVKIIFFEDFIQDTVKVLQDLFFFLEVDPDVQCNITKVYNKSGIPRSKILSRMLVGPNTLKRFAKLVIPKEQLRQSIWTFIHEMNTGRKPEIDPKAKAYLYKYFKDDVERLAGLLGRGLPWQKGLESSEGKPS